MHKLHSGMKRTFIWLNVEKLKVLKTVQTVADHVDGTTIIYLFLDRFHHHCYAYALYIPIEMGEVSYRRCI